MRTRMLHPHAFLSARKYLHELQILGCPCLSVPLSGSSKEGPDTALLSVTHLPKSTTNLTLSSLHPTWPTSQTLPLPRARGFTVQRSSMESAQVCFGGEDGPWRRWEMLSDISSASQPLILVLLHFLAAQQSNEQSNPFGNLFLLLYSFEEVMTLEIASPGGMKGPDSEPHYTRVCVSRS